MNKKLIAKELLNVAKTLMAGTKKVTVEEALDIIKRHKMDIEEWSTDIKLEKLPKPEEWLSVKYTNDLGVGKYHKIVVRLKNRGYMVYA